MEILKEFFLPMDIEAIKAIPLCTAMLGDFWAWSYEKSGLFSVRSAYRMLVHTRERRTAWLEHSAGYSNVASVEKEWGELWKIKVPSKVRVFLWRLAR